MNWFFRFWIKSHWGGIGFAMAIFTPIAVWYLLDNPDKLPAIIGGYILGISLSIYSNRKDFFKSHYSKVKNES